MSPETALLSTLPSPQPHPHPRGFARIPFTESQVVTVLSVSASQADHDALAKMIDPAWTIATASSIAAARANLRHHRVSLMVVDSDSFDDAWQEFIAAAPHVIVSSRRADALLWAEALNLGAWDVLAKPFDPQEVTRVLGMALGRTKAAVAHA